ncbi:ADP-ribosylation factor GTPase-activating protein 2 [Chionoecetes opilio]|uniref:ADP-ribosylation factor GTPase-activating protein 2 n=1 Tax=Chionoecetes opilio TaxID=41210 RepID=A0A8J4YBP1_CHIOP|nr:ADP-ribosylation factor GTPase-activating protein 2 [Chionoecetes opilio]
MSLAGKREEERMKRTDPMKAQQAERLGMGLGVRSGASHSMFGEMKTISQESPKAPSSSLGNNNTTSFRDEEIEDDFETIIRFSSGPPKYRDSPFEDQGNFGFSSGKGPGIDDLLNNKTAVTSSWDNEFDKTNNSSTNSSKNLSNLSSSKVSASANYKFNPVEDNQAQQKFGNAKAISSDMFFQDRDPDTEVRSNLARYEGSTSISSAELFGSGQQNQRQSYSGGSLQAPDLDEVRESVRQGVTKVAGRLGNLANNVMSSLQVLE